MTALNTYQWHWTGLLDTYTERRGYSSVYEGHCLHCHHSRVDWSTQMSGEIDPTPQTGSYTGQSFGNIAVNNTTMWGYTWQRVVVWKPYDKVSCKAEGGWVLFWVVFPDCIKITAVTYLVNIKISNCIKWLQPEKLAHLTRAHYCRVLVPSN